MTPCRKFRPSSAATCDGKQGFSCFEGISRESAGAQVVCLHLLAIPPGGRARAHKHATHETANHVLEGTTVMHRGARIEHRMEIAAGAMLCIPADMSHLPYNPGPGVACAVIARTDPHEQESVVLMPELEGLVPG